LLFISARVLDANERIEENLRRELKGDSMFGHIAGRLFRIPHETLTLVEKINVHYLNCIYVVYPSVKALHDGTRQELKRAAIAIR
jgi:hypothetical protein